MREVRREMNANNNNNDNNDDDARRDLRYAVYWLLILTSLAACAGRIFSLESSLGETPLLSANDRSRWCTIRALVDHGTYVIDEVIFSDLRKKRRDREWYTIDMVRHKGWDGQEHYYSSKPPLLATLLAGPYWLIKTTMGATLKDEPFYVVRLMLVIANVLPLAVYFVLLVRYAERFCQTDWSRLFLVAAGTQATFLTAFAVTLNNHLPAAISVMIALYAAARVWCHGQRNIRHFAVAGLFAAFAAANELPALSFLAGVALVLMLCSPSRTMLAFVPAAALVAVAFFGTNYAAHGTLRPPYAHRADGQLLAVLDEDVTDELDAGAVPAIVREALADEGIDISGRAVIARKTSDTRWVLWDLPGQDRIAIVRDGDTFRLHAWDNWYDYERSYWTAERKTGVDRGEPSRSRYAFHVIAGHYGIFSLTPVWLLSLFGAVHWIGRKQIDRPAAAENARIPDWIAGERGLALAIVLLSAVCLLFYLVRPLQDRNYGGVTNGFRWMFWFIPMWLMLLAPAGDRIADRRSLRLLAYVLFAASVLSANDSPLNPWTHPWIYRYLEYLRWI